MKTMPEKHVYVSLPLQLQGLEERGKLHPSVKSEHENSSSKKTAGDGESEERVLTLSKEEQRELEIQFAGSVIHFNCITVDSENSLGQGVHPNEVVITCRKWTQMCVFYILTSFPGAFGKVYSGSIKRGGVRTIVAIKTIKSKSEIHLCDRER